MLKHWQSIRRTSPSISKRRPSRGGALHLLVMWGMTLLLASCLPQANAAPVLRIGLIAPFETLGRPLGYALLPEVKDAIARFNADPAHQHRVALIALNDDLDPDEAAARARALALDPTVVGVIGPWSDAAARAAAPVLEDAAMPVIFGVPAPTDFAMANGWSVCPEHEEIAGALVTRAGSLGQFWLIAGPENALADALSTANPGAVQLASDAPPADSTVIYTGGAEDAASDLTAWRAAGWQGVLLGGPDMAQPWFIAHAGAAVAEGVEALACGGEEPLPNNPVELALQAGAAETATEALLDAIAVAANAPGGPTREGIAAALAANPPARELSWLIVSAGDWAVRRD